MWFCTPCLALEHRATSLPPAWHHLPMPPPWPSPLSPYPSPDPHRPAAGARGPPLSYDSPNSSAMGYSSTSSAAFSPSPSASPIAFGRTLSNSASGRRPPSHPTRRPSPSLPNLPNAPGPSHTWQPSQRGAKASRVSSAGVVHSSSSTPGTAGSSSARAGTHHAHSAHGGSGAGAAGGGRVGGYSNIHSGGFGRSSSLPVRSSAHGAPPKTPAGSASAAVLARRLSADDDDPNGQGQRQRGSSSGYTPTGEAPPPLPPSAPALAGPGGVSLGPGRPASSDGPSDSDGDSDEGPAELPPSQRSPVAAATATSPVPRPVRKVAAHFLTICAMIVSYFACPVIHTVLPVCLCPFGPAPCVRCTALTF